MSITYGDNLKHNNPLFPIVDVEAVISGGLVPGDIYQTLSNVLMVVI